MTRIDKVVSKAANRPAAVKARAAKKPAADKVVRAAAAAVVRAVAIKPDAETGRSAFKNERGESQKCAHLFFLMPALAGVCLKPLDGFRPWKWTK
jgi:hypothetical protein